jgi:hypothetical protein
MLVSVKMFLVVVVFQQPQWAKTMQRAHEVTLKRTLPIMDHAHLDGPKTLREIGEFSDIALCGNKLSICARSSLPHSFVGKYICIR